MVSDQTIKAGGFKQRRKVKTFSKEKTDGGRLGISRDTSCPAKSSTAFVTVKPTRRLTIKCQAPKRRLCKKCAALDKQHTDAEKRQRGRRREQDNKAGMRPRFEKL